MSDFQVKVGGDFSEFLGKLGQLPQEASKAGQGIGKGLDDGIKQYSEKSLAALNAELNRLQQRQIKVAVDSSAFEKAGVKIKEVQSLISAVEKQRLLIGVDDRSITAVQVKLADLQNKQTKVSVDSQEFVELQRQINATEKELQEISQRKVLINADANSFLAVTAKLRNELNSLQERQLKVDVDSQEFIALGREIDRIEGELSSLERKRTAVTIDASSVQALQAKLQDLQTRQTKVSVDSQEFVDLQRQIDGVQRELQEVDSKRITVDADGSSLIALTTRFKAELQALEQKRVKVDVDSQEFVDLSRQIDQVESELSALERRKLLINADPSSIIALRSRLNELQGELEKTQIGSQRFRELQGEVRKTEADLRNAGESAGGLQGVIQSLGPAIAAIGIGAGLAAFTRNAFDAAAAAESAEVRIKALGDQFGEADKIQQMVAASAKQLNITNTEAADGFLQLYGALRPTGISLDDIGTVFTATNAAAKNFGLSAGSVQAAVLQLSQGLAAGTLQGDELRSIMEQMPPVAQAIAKEMGITVGEVKKFGSEGKITSDIVIKAIKGMNDVELGKLDKTLQTTQERINAQKVAFNELSVTVGNVFVQASLPVIEALTSIAKGLADAAQAAIDAPAPLKALAAVLIGLPAAYLTARLAVIAFNSELIGGQIKAAIAGIQQLGVLLKTQFITDLAAAKAAWAAFSTSVQTGALQQQVGALAAKFGPLALAIGAVVVAVDTYNRSTADSRQIAESAAANLDELTASLTAAGIETSELTTLGGPFARAIQNNTDALSALLAPLEGIPAIGPLVVSALKGIADTALTIIPGLKGATEAISFLFGKWRKSVADANTTQGLEQASIALGRIQTRSTEAENAASKLFAELQKAGGPPNPAQLEQINKLIPALEQARGKTGELVKQLELQAAAARSSGNDELADGLLKVAELARKGIPIQEIRIKQLQSLIPLEDRKTQQTKEQESAIKARAQAEAELNKIIATAPVRNLEAQITLGQQLVSLSQALADREQSRFAVTKAGLEFELAQAEKRGASEAQIGAIKKQIQELDRQALQARFQALKQEQQLQVKMLELSQQKARLEADLSVQEQRAEILKAQVELQKAQASGSQAEIAAASAQVELQQAILGIKTQQQNTLKQTQPIEAAILGLQQETAINGERAKAAQMGYRFEANGSLVAVNALAGAADRVGVVTANSATEQARLTSVAQQTGLAIERAADGSFVLGRNQQDVGNATAALNRQLDGTAAAAGKTATAASGMQGLIEGTVDPATGIAKAFDETGGLINQINVQQGRDFAAWLSSAKTFGEQITKLPLVNQMGEVANRTQSAANAAKVFYDWLERASRLPGSRWTGGPVDAGEQYRVNELGQEALLAGGRLSLINAAPNSLWRAPANGTVIPAGITSRLQEQGALPGRAGAALPMGGGGSNAALAVEVGKLRQEVGELARKQWNVNITTKTGPTGSQVLKQMLR